MISALLGRPLMPWQQYVVDVALEVQSEAAGDPSPGEWAYGFVTVTVPRQAGKTKLVSAVVAHRLGSGRDRRVFGTAQNRKKAVKRWRDTVDEYVGSALGRGVKRKIGTGHEELRWLSTNSTFEPFAPNEGDMHGETPDLVTVDELWAFDHEQARIIQAAYVPGFLTKDAQEWKFSTAGTEKAWWLNTARKAGRQSVERGERLGTAYFEWSLPDRIDGKRIKDLTDDELVQACIDNHPATGHTVRPTAVWLAWQQMDDRSEFIRAYGNRTAEDLAGRWQAIDEKTWNDQFDQAGIPAGARIGFGVWIDEDEGIAAVSAGFRDDSGQMHVEVLQTAVNQPDGSSQMVPAVREGVRWLKSFLVARTTKATDSFVAIANIGAARDVADELEAAGVTVVRIGQADVTAACGRHRSELQGGTWWHATSNEATRAAEAAGWAKASGGFRWDQPGDSIAALGSQTFAGWGIDHAPAVAPKLGRFSIG